MNLAGTVETDDDVIANLGERGGVADEEEAGRKDGDPNTRVVKQCAEIPEMAVEQRLAAREHNPPDAELLPLPEPALHLGSRDLLASLVAPDVAHQAAAVAAAVGIEDEDGKPGHRIFAGQRRERYDRGPRAGSEDGHRRSSSSR